MNMQKISNLAADVLYLDADTVIEPDKSLFTVYGMSSLDFIDFSFELKGVANKDFTPDDLWPINKMMTDPECFARSRWTDKGLKELTIVFNGDDGVSAEQNAEDLYQRFTVAFIEKRLQAI